jgi:ribose transport system permease protein
MPTKRPPGALTTKPGDQDLPDDRRGGEPGAGPGGSAVITAISRAGDGTAKAREWSRKYLVLLLLPLFLGVFSAAAPTKFATFPTMQTLLTTNAALLILVVGQTLIFVVGEFDLSFSGLVGMSGALAVAFHGASTGEALVFSLAAALVIGLINAFFVVGLGVSSLIATLGMGTVTTGIGLAATHSGEAIPNPYSGLGTALGTTVGGIGVPFLVGLVIMVLLWVVLERTRWGRNAYFVGAGRRAAAYAGISVNRTRVIAFVMSALAAWAAGLVLFTQSGSADATFGSGYILDVFAAVFLGFSAIKPGRYNAIGSFIGILVLAIGTTGIEVLAAPIWLTDVFSGSILFMAVAMANILGNAKGLRALRSAIE